MEQPEYERMYQVEDFHWWFVSRRQLALALIEHWLGPRLNARFLDVGCGTGGNLAYLARWGCGAGVDLSPLALRLARRRSLPRLAQASSLALPYPDHTFDLATLFDVLYHRWVSDDEQALREVYRVLRPGGWLLLTEAALPGLWSAHDEIYYGRQRYTLAVLQHKLTQTDFRVAIISYTNMFLLPIMAVTRWMTHWLPVAGDLDLWPLPPWLNRLLVNVRGVETAWLRRGRRLPVGSSLVCLAQKPGF